ncbi:hypothetical protein D3C72_2482150 [compost metagenome]
MINPVEMDAPIGRNAAKRVVISGSTKSTMPASISVPSANVKEQNATRMPVSPAVRPFDP